MIAPRSAARTDQGGHPSHNEDHALVADCWWAVADGMGGHHGGEVASATATAALDEVLSSALHGTCDRPLPVEDVARALAASVDAVGAALRDRARADASLSQMGTTCVVAAIASDPDGVPSVIVANVGDSRAYLLAGEHLTPLTRDDNVAEEMRSLGIIEAEQVATHPGQYQLTKALTAYDASTPAPTITSAPAQGRLLLCSDGLTGELSDTTIAGLLGRGGVDEAADALVRAAVRAPARDNVTVVVIDLG